VPPAAHAIARRRPDEPCPLSFAQERLWFLDELSPGSVAYNLPVAMPLLGGIDAAALAWALNEIVRRHEVLRTTFESRGGRPVQVIAPASRLALPIVDRSDLPEHELPAEAARLAAAELERRFDLARGPLLATTLVRLGPGEHLLLLTMHHIVADGWSLGIFLRELEALYQARCAGQVSPLPELPIQYADFALWQRRWLESEALAPALAYWKRQLHGAPARLEVPGDRERPVVQSASGALLKFSLSAELVGRMAALGRALSVAPFATLLAAFLLLLQRWCRQDDVVVGTPIANRNRTEIEGLIGFFVNMLVLRADLSGGPSFRAAVRRVHEVTLDAYTFQDLPFERLVEELQPERNLGHHPLFQVSFMLQNAPPLQGRQGTRDKARFAPETAGVTAKFDVGLALGETEEGLAGAVEYNTDLFDATTMRRLAGHYATILEGALADPEHPAADLALLAPGERHQLLLEWNDSAAALASGSTLPELVAAQARHRPGAVAVVFDGRRLTYGELETHACHLAHHLRRLGVGPEVVAGIAMEGSLEMVVGVLGILKAGGAYLPLDLAGSRDRLAFALDEARPPVLLTQQRLAARLPETGASVVCLDAIWRSLEDEPSAPPPGGGAPENLAYVIYTSGSTGRPKGSMVSHRAIANHLLWMQSRYRLTEADRVLQKTPASCDVSVWEIFWPLLAGACLVVARPEGHKDAGYLVELVDAQRITVLHCGPAMLRAFLAEPGAGACGSLRFVIASGDTLPPRLVADFEERLGAGLENLYGPAEAAVDVASWSCRGGARRRSVPIGRPIANLQVLLLDRHLGLAPAGVPGELHIGGAGLARGYLGRPGQTAERFVPHPYAAAAGERLFRTGDLARRLPDGTTELLGRLDHEVELRGYRIELGEIEAALRTHPGVREAAVLLHHEGPGDDRLVSFVGIDPPAARGGDLRPLLEGRLPEYMIPAVFIELPALPLTPSGRVDRRALAALIPSLRPAERQGVPPRDALEELVAEAWREVLKLERVGVHDSFFELGGHSLLATQVLSRINDRCGFELPLRRFFERPTVAGLATILEQGGLVRQPLAATAPAAGGPAATSAPAEARPAPAPPVAREPRVPLPAPPLAREPRVPLPARMAPAAPLSRPAEAAPRPGDAGLPVEWLCQQAHVDYSLAVERTWTEIQQRSLGLQLGLPDAPDARQDSLAEVREEGRQRLRRDYLRYLESVRDAWSRLDGSGLDPAALARIGQGIAAVAWHAAAAWEPRPDQRRDPQPGVHPEPRSRREPAPASPLAARPGPPRPASPERPRQGSAPGTVAAVRAAAPRVAPLSFAQERLWLLDQLEPGSPLYNIPTALPLVNVDAPALERALNEILRRHEVLRSTVQAIDDQPAQLIHPAMPVRLEILDRRALSAAERTAETERLAREEATQPFDLARGPLLRAVLVRLSAQESLLLLTLHHIAADGWSMGIFFAELSALYQAFSSGRPSPLPDLEFQYADFVRWQRERLQGETLAQLIAYWRRQLAGAPPVLRLPTDRPRPPDQTFRGALTFFALPAAVLAAVNHLGQRRGVTLFMSLLAAYVALLYRYTGAEDLVVGAPIANRNRAQLEGLIGFFVNTLVLRFRVSGNLSFTDLLGRVSEVTLEAFDHQDLPFEKLVEQLAPERTLGHSPLCQVVFNLQNIPTWGPAEEAAPRLVPHSGTAKFDLNLTMAAAPQGLLGAFEYNTDLFEETTILRMRDHLAAILEQVTQDPAVRILDIRLQGKEGAAMAEAAPAAAADEAESFAF